MRDMVPPEKDSRSIRNIQINKNKTTEPEEETSATEGESENRPLRNGDFDTRTRTRRRGKSYRGWLIVLGIIILVFIFISLTPVLSKANVTVTPRYQAVEVSGQFTASPENSSEEADMTYQTTSLELIGDKSAPATGEEEVSRKAAGTIKVFNEFSEEPERLIANTRFETSEGLIYRVQNPITIPGYTRSGEKIVPGTLEVTVYADEAGQRYNIQSAKFTIPGLAGDARFEKMYAEAVSPISGGFQGVTKVAKEEDVTLAREAIRKELGDQILDKAQQEVPEDFVLLPNTLSVRFESLPEESGEASDVLVREKAVATVALFKKSQLASFIAEETIGTYDGEDVRIDNLDSLKISVDETAKDAIASAEGTTFNFSISGDPLIVWVVDYDALTEDLHGVSRDEASNILSEYSSIKEAEINISPFWRRSIPDQEDKVNVEEVINVEEQ